MRLSQCEDGWRLEFGHGLSVQVLSRNGLYRGLGQVTARGRPLRGLVHAV